MSQLLIVMGMRVGVESEHGRFDGGSWVEESGGRGGGESGVVLLDTV